VGLGGAALDAERLNWNSRSEAGGIRSRGGVFRIEQDAA
jgi:hypothetical protein